VEPDVLRIDLLVDHRRDRDWSSDLALGLWRSSGFGVLRHQSRSGTTTPLRRRPDDDDVAAPPDYRNGR
jgi:hypothetical protein